MKVVQPGSVEASEDARSMARPDTLVWEPIDSAPRDETRIIGMDWRGYGRLSLCWWQPEFGAWISGARIMTMAPGYTVDGMREKLHSPEIETPTHWIAFPHRLTSGAHEGVRARVTADTSGRPSK